MVQRLECVMSKLFQFGEQVEGVDIAVLNEREIRAAAGILFLMIFISFMTVVLTDNFLLLKYAVTIFLIDISLRVFISPRFAPTLIIGRLIVRNQTPEYVGAQQKKFAWIIGVVLAAIFFAHTVVMNSVSPVSGIICFICMIFLFFEAAFGICLGCKFYPLFHKQKAQLCPGEVCDPKAKQPIQKTSSFQILTVLVFISLIVLLALFANEYFSTKPFILFGPDSAAK
jgi:hypothetical protein